jgi:hypothetical protein
MAKITRSLQKVFADGVVAQNNIAQFGSLKADAVLFSKDPAVIQFLAAFEQGWASAVVNNQAPTLQDMNALFFLITRQIAYLMQAGVAEYDTETVYYIGSVVSDGAGALYRSLVDTNTDALSVLASWSPVIDPNGVYIRRPDGVLRKLSIDNADNITVLDT